VNLHISRYILVITWLKLRHVISIYSLFSGSVNLAKGVWGESIGVRELLYSYLAEK
jgi:hypothetical protein